MITNANRQTKNLDFLSRVKRTFIKLKNRKRNASRSYKNWFLWTLTKEHLRRCLIFCIFQSGKISKFYKWVAFAQKVYLKSLEGDLHRQKEANNWNLGLFPCSKTAQNSHILCFQKSRNISRSYKGYDFSDQKILNNPEG